MPRKLGCSQLVNNMKQYDATNDVSNLRRNITAQRVKATPQKNEKTMTGM